MNKTLKCTSVVLNENRSAVQFIELDKDKKNVLTITLNFQNASDAQAFQFGKTYDIAFTEKKK